MTTDTDNIEELLSQVDDDVTAARPAAVAKEKGAKRRAAQPPSVSARALLPAMHQGDPNALDNVKGVIGSEEVSLAKGWMRFHHMELVKSASRVRELVDRAIQVGRVALDTETQGLDTRIEYDDTGRPRTHHAIIGYCLGLEGAGYYIPVRHKPEDCFDQVQPNVDSVEQTEAEITRLCQAAQPVLKRGRDILGAKETDFEVPPRVIIEFWHAKFDQEMLYPVTGIDLWNPYSFEDGMLQVYALCSEDDQGLKENAKLKLPPVVDPVTKEAHPYEMIEYEHLFAKGMKKSKRKLEKLVPRAEGEGHNVVLYACSDGICTNLLCGLLGPLIKKGKGLTHRFYTIEKQVAQVVRVIERTRVLINKGEIASLLEEAERELLACEELIRKQAHALGFPEDFNPSSTPQLADFLFGPKGVWKGAKPEKTAKGQFKTDEKTIENYAKSANAPEAFSLIVKHRQINKIRGTYLKNLANNTDELDQLRLNFMQTGAATGRFTAPKGDPKQGYAGIPIQGIPAKDDPKKPKVAHSLRRMFIARPGYVIVKVDYASQELRIAASTSGEPKWIAEYEKEATTGEPADLHWLTAQAFYPGLTKDSPDHKLKRGQGKCVHPDTLVSTSHGYRPIGRIAAFPDVPDTFAQVPVGLEVDGRPVVQTYNGGVKPLVHVVTRKGVVTCTTQHRFLTAKGEFVAAGDLRKGDELWDAEFSDPQGSGVGTLELKLWKGVPAAGYPVTLDLCYFAGAFLGDGSVCASGARITHGHVDKLDAFDCPYVEWQQVLLDACARVGIESEAGPDNVYLGSRVTVRYLSGLGLVVPRPGTADGRMKRLRVPDWALAFGREGILSLLGGLIDTDGSAAHQVKTIEFTTKDFIFGGQIAAVAQAVGLSLTCEATFNRTYQRYYLRLRFSVESSWRLAPYLRYAGKKARLGPPTQRSMMREANDVLVVIPAGGGECVDVTMGTEEHVYRANGIVTHNTANFALIYGGGVGAVQRATGCDQVEGARMKEAFDQSVPVFSRWVKGQKESVKLEKGVYTAFKRFISIPDATIGRDEVIRRLRKAEAKKKKLTEEQASELTFNEADVGKEVKKARAACERKATNYPIQGAGADILKISLVFLLRELFLRGWLKIGGGDDSVRIIMTIHDEIVFEIREERVAEALPIITKIMEHPYRLARWKVPLVAEAELGPSWAAKLKWADILKGKVPRPAYLEGVEIKQNPHVLVIDGDDGGEASKPLPPPPAWAPTVTPSPPSPAPASTSVASAPTSGHASATARVEPPTEVLPSANGSSSGRPRRVASFKLQRLFLDRKAVIEIAGACSSAVIEGMKRDEPDQEMVIEILIGSEDQNVLLWPAEEGYRVHVQELETNLRRLGVLDSVKVREIHA